MSWRKFYVDLVDGPRQGERVELPWGKPDFFVMPEAEIPFSLGMPSEVMLCNINPIKYCAMENGKIMGGQTEWGLVYRIEQWSVDGKRDEYERLFWQRLSEYSHM